MSHEREDERPEAPEVTFESIELPESSRSWRPSRRAIATTLVALSVAGLGVYDTLGSDLPVLPWGMNGRDWSLAFCLAVLGSIAVGERDRLGPLWRRYPKDPLSLFGLVVVALFVSVGVVGPALVDEPIVDLANVHQPPAFASVDAATVPTCAGEVSDGRCHGTWDHPLGTQHEGRDLLAYVVYGTRTALEMAALVTMIAVPIAVAVGTTAAYAGGRLDSLLMRYTDVQQVFPAFFVYLVFWFMYGPSQAALIVIFGLLTWSGVARIVRSAVIRERQEAYVMAARSAGAGSVGIVRRHVLPNVTGSIVTAVTVQVPFLIVAEAALSFLHLGHPYVYSWGKVINDGLRHLTVRPWIALIPGLVLVATILGCYLLGDALQKAFDPKLE